MKRTITPSLALLACSALAAAQTEDFEAGNPNDWSFELLPNSIEAVGGNPDGHLLDATNVVTAPGGHMLFRAYSVNHPYKGDLRAMGVSSMNWDISADVASSNFGCRIYLVIGQDGGLAGLGDDCIVWTDTGLPVVGFGPGTFAPGTWYENDNAIPSASLTMPAGWFTGSNAGPNPCAGATNDDIWNSVITNADYIGWSFGRPDGLDNIAMQPRIDNIELVGSAFGTNYCTPTVNSTGSAATMTLDGSPSIADGDFEMSAGPVPNEPFVFYMGPNQISAPFGDGVRCVGGSVTRIWPPGLASGNVANRTVDLATFGAMPGTVNIQCWFRDPTGGSSGFNLSDGISAVLTP